MTELIFSNIITALCSGSLSWLFTLKYQRKEAEASVTAKVQEVYNNMINDLQSDRERLKSQIGSIQDDRDRLKMTVEEIQCQVLSLKKQVEKNERLIKQLRPSACALAPTCKNFQLKELYQS